MRPLAWPAPAAIAALPAIAALALALAAGGCGERRSAVEEETHRAWRAHELVISAGELSATCAEAGAAMQRVFAAHRQAFTDGAALSRDREKLSQAADYIERHEDRYRDLETRMAALSDRCIDEPTVVAVFRMMDSP